MRIRFLPWDDRLACIHLVYHVWGPALSHPTDPYVAWALYFADPKLFVVDLEEIKDIVHRLAWRKPLKREQRTFVRMALKLMPPTWFKERVLESYRKLQEKWGEVEKYLEEIVSRAHGGEVLKKEIRVFPSVEIRGCGGSAYIDEVGMSFSYEWSDEVLRIFAHELIHIFHHRDKKFDAFLKDLEEKYKLPVHEAHTEALTNLFWWRAGRAEKMFHRHYKRGWKELETFEKQYWVIVERWWKGGGNLYELVKEELGEKDV